MSEASFVPGLDAMTVYGKTGLLGVEHEWGEWADWFTAGAVERRHRKCANCGQMDYDERTIAGWSSGSSLGS